MRSYLNSNILIMQKISELSISYSKRMKDALQEYSNIFVTRPRTFRQKNIQSKRILRSFNYIWCLPGLFGFITADKKRRGINVPWEIGQERRQRFLDLLATVLLEGMLSIIVKNQISRTIQSLLNLRCLKIF